MPKQKRMCWCLRLWHSFYNSEIVFLALISVHSALEPFRKDRFKWLILVLFFSRSLSLSNISFDHWVRSVRLPHSSNILRFVACVFFSRSFSRPLHFHTVLVFVLQTLMPLFGILCHFRKSIRFWHFECDWLRNRGRDICVYINNLSRSHSIDFFLGMIHSDYRTTKHSLCVFVFERTNAHHSRSTKTIFSSSFARLVLDEWQRIN